MMTMTTEPDSSSNAVLATATLVGTVESSQKRQQQQQIVSITPVTNNSVPNEDGKGLGVAMFVLQLVGLILFLGIYPPLGALCFFITIILSLILPIHLSREL